MKNKKNEKIKLLKEKFQIAVQIKDYERAKKFLIKIRDLEK